MIVIPIEEEDEENMVIEDQSNEILDSYSKGSNTNSKIMTECITILSSDTSSFSCNEASVDLSSQEEECYINLEQENEHSTQELKNSKIKQDIMSHEIGSQSDRYSIDSRSTALENIAMANSYKWLFKESTSSTMTNKSNSDPWLFPDLIDQNLSVNCEESSKKKKKKKNKADFEQKPKLKSKKKLDKEKLICNNGESANGVNFQELEKNFKKMHDLKCQAKLKNKRKRIMLRKIQAINAQNHTLDMNNLPNNNNIMDEFSCQSKKRKMNEDNGIDDINDKEDGDCTGNRIMNMKNHDIFLDEYSQHCINCQVKPIFIHEIRFGLYSEFVYQCPKCKEPIMLCSTDKSKPKPGIHDINYQFVLASLLSGLGYWGMCEIACLLDLKLMAGESYRRVLYHIKNALEQEIEESMDRKLAIEMESARKQGHFSGGKPAISAIGDAQWSKRSYGHTLNANAAVGVLIGSVSSKIIYIGTKNRYCSICTQDSRFLEEKRKSDEANEKARALIEKDSISNYQNDEIVTETQIEKDNFSKASNINFLSLSLESNLIPNENTQKTTLFEFKRKTHVCYKNWEGSSTTMEAVIIKEGFETIDKKGARITTYIADQDAATYKYLRGLEWGREIHKIDCVNHHIRNFISGLEDIIKRNKLNEILGDEWRINFVSLIQLLIKKFSENPEEFRKHILNSRKHMLGIHIDCDKQIYCHHNHVFREKHISVKAIQEIDFVLQRIAMRAGRIKAGVTNNLAEAFFSVNSKFQAGKRKNFIQRDNYRTRCLAAALSYNEGPKWSINLLEKYFNIKGAIMSKFFEKKEKKIIQERARKSTEKYKEARRKRRINNRETGKNIESDKDYGPNNSAWNIMNEPTQDEEEKMKKACEEYYQKKVIVNNETRKKIRAETIEKDDCLAWWDEIKIRLTPFNFKEIAQRKPDADPTRLVAKILYQKDKPKNMDHLHSQLYEEQARQKYAQQNKKIIKRTGLIIHKEHHFLACAPDGLVIKEKVNAGENDYEYIIEIKAIEKYKSYTKEKFETSKDFFLRFNTKKNIWTLRPSHEYYYHIQGKLEITNCPYCDLVVFAADTGIMIICRIVRDLEFWQQKLFRKLRDFYWNLILPELIISNLESKKGLFRYSDCNTWIKPKKNNDNTKEIDDENTKINSNKNQDRQLRFSLDKLRKSLENSSNTNMKIENSNINMKIEDNLHATCKNNINKPSQTNEESKDTEDKNYEAMIGSIFEEAD